LVEREHVMADKAQTAGTVQTIEEFQAVLRGHPDVAVSLRVQDAIGHLLSAKQIQLTDEVNRQVLADIRSQIYEDAKNPDPIALIFQAMAGKTDNPVEAALQFIEKKARASG
jgi:hypothetical protein